VKFSEIATKYTEITPLRIVLTNIIPVFGPSIDLALSHYADDIYKKRIENALDNLENEIKILKEDTLDPIFFKSEIFFDVFRLYLEKSIRTRQNEKVRCYAKLLTNTVKFPEKTEQVEQEIEKISLLSVRDLKIIKIMYEDNLRDSHLFGNPDDFVEGTLSMQQIPNNLPEIDGLTKSEVEESMYILISTGFVREFAGGAGTYRGGWYFLTPLLKEIMQKIILK
jgi:hypothetical protein